MYSQVKDTRGLAEDGVCHGSRIVKHHQTLTTPAFLHLRSGNSSRVKSIWSLRCMLLKTACLGHKGPLVSPRSQPYWFLHHTITSVTLSAGDETHTHFCPSKLTCHHSDGRAHHHDNLVPANHESQCWINVGPASATLYQHQNSIECLLRGLSTSCVGSMLD